jgi:hypothetical protein
MPIRMPRRLRRAIALFAKKGAVLGAALPLGCGSSGQSASDSGSQADSSAAGCPATLAETIGAPCNVEHLLCDPSSYTCGLIEVPIVCICTSRAFQCTDGAGNPLGIGETPSCPEAPEAGSCPATEMAAALSGCSTLGVSCQYSSACGVGLDQCECLRGPVGDGGVALRFECQQATCSSVDAAAGSSDGSLDAVPDAAMSVGSELE